MAKHDDRTEKPTPRRRQEARKRGESARSVELPQAASLVAVVVMLPLVVPRLTEALTDGWARSLALAQNPEPHLATAVLGDTLVAAALALAPMLAMTALMSVTAQAALVGGRPNIHRLKPRFDGLNPVAGVKRLFSRQILWELFRTSAKLAAVAVVAVMGWEAAAAAFTGGPRPIRSIISTIAAESNRLLVRLAVLAAAVGIADAVVSRRRFEKKLRMTKQEAKEDHRQAEGDPVIRAEVRRRMTRMSRLRMMAEVARADVVLTNPTHIAVALRYRDDDPAPVVVAKGAGFVARRIREEAERHGVPVRENKPLARALHATVEIGQVIPVELYRAVAEVLAVIYRAKNRLPGVHVPGLQVAR